MTILIASYIAVAVCVFVPATRSIYNYLTPTQIEGAADYAMTVFLAVLIGAFAAALWLPLLVLAALFGLTVGIGHLIVRSSSSVDSDEKSD